MNFLHNVSYSSMPAMPAMPAMPCLWFVLWCAMLMTTIACSKTSDRSDHEHLKDFTQVEYAPEPGSLRRLTLTQYHNAIRTLLGPDVILPSRLEPDLEVAGLKALGASRTTISARGVEVYERAAYDLAEQVMDDTFLRDKVIGCAPSLTDDGCIRSFIFVFGRRAWRRPLRDVEVSRLLAIASKAGEVTNDPYDALEYVLAALLQSPKFLFRHEIGETDLGKGIRAFSDLEIATRLSFFLWNNIPDDELLDAALRGDLTADEGLKAQVERMLKDERTREGVRNFFTELFSLHKLDDLSKAPEIYPHIGPNVGPSAREETLRVLEYLIFEERADYRDIMTTRHTFINRKLASLYNVRAPARDGFAPFSFPKDSPRVGILGHVSVLAQQAHPVSSSPTLRGIFIRKTLLCHKIPDPPANVDTSIPEPSGMAPTLRARIKEHLEVESCAGCHSLVDPLGLALEPFDGLGSWRAVDNGVAIDASGELDGVAFEGPVALANAIRAHRDFAPCFVKNMYRYAVGHTEQDGEDELLEVLFDAFERRGHQVLDLMQLIALSPGFRIAHEPVVQVNTGT